VLRVGALGAAQITPGALVVPAAEHPDVQVTAVAARDPERARTFAELHGIPRALPDYATLVSDPDVDAVYVALPHGLHGHWTRAALEAGKHVLVEKPFAANAGEAEAVAAVARRTGLVVMEAFHYRYHALTERVLDLIASGELGEVERIETWFHAHLGDPDDIRWQLHLAGGAMMDIGCYPVHMLRTVAGAEPVVDSVEVRLRSPGVDSDVRAELSFADGRTGSIGVSMLSGDDHTSGLRVRGTKGTVEVENPIAPHTGHRVVVRSGPELRSEAVPSLPTTYAAQLAAFVAAVQDGTPFPTDVDDAVANLRVIDAVYETAGLPRREPTPT
jgi:predicted dehydrogenase